MTPSPAAVNKTLPDKDPSRPGLRSAVANVAEPGLGAAKAVLQRTARDTSVENMMNEYEKDEVRM